MTHSSSRLTFFVCQQEEALDLGILDQLLQSAGCHATIFKHFEKGSMPLFDPAKHAGLILLGGGHESANKRGAYQKEKSWIRKAFDLGRPILGICQGAQLLVDVYRGPNGELGRVRRGLVRDGEYGWKRVILTDEGKSDPVLKHAIPGCDVLQSHQDWCQLPADAVNLAYSETACALARKHGRSNSYSEAFRIGTLAYGIQFHPELTREMLKGWISSRGGVVYELPRKERMDECLPGYFEVGERLLAAWLQLAITSAGK